MDAISVCMIVKNEEHNLERCLKSISGLVEEIIVVDTGSSDNTVEIAKKFTKNVLSFAWKDDFATARNFAASFATKEWILVLDADEFIEEKNFLVFKEELITKYTNNSNIDILIPKIINFIGKKGESTAINFHERIYKNNKGINYYREIHEELKSDFEIELNRSYCNLHIYHSGYLEIEKEKKNKLERNLKILNKIKNKRAIDYYYLGNELVSQNKIAEAIECYLKSYKLEINKDKDWILDLLVRLIGCLIEENRIYEAKNIIIACKETHSNIGEFLYFSAYIDYLEMEFEKAIIKFNELIDNKNIITIYSEDYTKLNPLKILNNINRMSENHINSIKYTSLAININPTSIELWVNLLKVLSKDSNNDELNNFIQKNILDNTVFSDLDSILILGSINHLGISQYLLDNLSSVYNEIPNLIKDSLEQKILFLQGNFISVVENLLTFDPKYVEEILNLGILNFYDLLFLYNKTNKVKIKLLLNKIDFSKNKKMLYKAVINNDFSRKTIYFEEYISYKIHEIDINYTTFEMK